MRELKRIFIGILAVCFLCSFDYMNVTIFASNINTSLAAATSPEKGMVFWNENTKTNLNPPAYSGESDAGWIGSKLYWGVNESVPMKWRILNTNETDFGPAHGMLVMHDDANQLKTIDGVEFNSSSTSQNINVYKASGLETFVDSKYNSSAVLNDNERAATLISLKSGEEYTVAGLGHKYIDEIVSKRWFVPTMNMMTNESYGYPNVANVQSKTRQFGSKVWTLSGKADDVFSVGKISDNGSLRSVYTTANSIQVIGAFQLDTTKILFVSNAEDATGKKPGNLAPVNDTASGEYKITLKDETQSVTVNSATIDASNVATINYDKTGEGTTLSAILTDKDGNNIISYGQLATIVTDDLSNKTATVQLPSDFFSSEYKLKIFTEIANGDKKTDYASELKDVELQEYQAPQSFKAMVFWNDDTQAKLNPPTYSEGNVDGWVGSKLYWGNNIDSQTPMKWRILNTKETNYGHPNGILMVHDDVNQIGLEEVKFNIGEGNENKSAYITSNLAAYIKERFTSSLEDKEEAATLKSSLNEEVYEISNYQPNPAIKLPLKDVGFHEEEWFAPTVKMMMNESYGFDSDAFASTSRVFEENIFLSTETVPIAPATIKNGTFLNKTGVMNSNRVWGQGLLYARRVISASQLNPDSILFISSAMDIDGKNPENKGPNALAPINDTASGEYKVTLKDETQSVTVNSASIDASNLATINYDKTGEGTTLSAIITDSTGETIISYGQLATIENKDLTNQTATVQVPEDFFTNGYKLQVFTEICNGDMKTDYASNPVDTNLVQPTRYTVTFNSDGGTSIQSQSILDGGLVVMPTAESTKDGYAFSGWYKEDKVTRWNFDTDTVTSDMTLHAKWEAKIYNIAYSLDGGTDSGNPNRYTIETATFTLKNPSKIGYTFVGWTGTNGNIAQMIVSIPSGSTETRLYIANWKLNEYRVTFDSKGGSGSTTLVAGYNTVLSKPSDPTKTGFTFEGWYLDEAYTTAWKFESDVVMSNMTLYAKWKANPEDSYKEDVKVDKDSQISATGMFEVNSQLSVELIEGTENSLYEQVQDQIILGSYEVKIIGSFMGKIKVNFPIEEQYEGYTVYIRHEKQDGSVEIFTRIAKDGKVSVEVDELSPFMLTIDKPQEDKPNEDVPNEDTPNEDLPTTDTNVKDVVETGDQTNFMSWALMLVMGTGVVGMCFRRKRKE